MVLCGDTSHRMLTRDILRNEDAFCSLRLILEDLFSLSKNVLNLLPQISFLYIELMTAIIETGFNILNLVVIICTITLNFKTLVMLRTQT
jgi:hypothetical protein